MKYFIQLALCLVLAISLQAQTTKDIVDLSKKAEKSLGHMEGYLNPERFEFQLSYYSTDLASKFKNLCADRELTDGLLSAFVVMTFEGTRYMTPCRVRVVGYEPIILLLGEEAQPISEVYVSGKGYNFYNNEECYGTVKDKYGNKFELYIVGIDMMTDYIKTLTKDKLDEIFSISPNKHKKA